VSTIIDLSALAKSPAVAAAGNGQFLGGRYWGFVGDSITNRSGALAGRAFVDLVPHMVGTRYIASTTNPTGIASTVEGVPGQTSDGMVNRFAGILAKGVQGICLLAGTNDVGQGVTVSTFLANMTKMLNMARAAGVPMVVGTVPPRSSAAGTATQHRDIVGFNISLHSWAAQHGVPLAPVYAYLVDNTTGYLTAAYDSGDGVHPSTAGHRQVARAFALALRKVVQSQPPVISSKTPVGLLANPLVSNSGSSWFEQPGGTGTAPTYSMVADTSGKLPAGGYWREMDWDASASGGIRTMAIAVSATGWSVGDQMAVFANIDYSDLSGNVGAGMDLDTTTADYKLQVTNQSGVILAGGRPPFSNSLGEICFNYVVPAGTTGMNLWYTCTLATGMRARFRLATVDVYSLTALVNVTGY